MTQTRTRQRGVSLIEALVAFAVLAFGMMGVAGMQSTMRSNADLARQRAEAVRLAQDAVEEWRAFSTFTSTTDRIAYGDVTGSDTRTVTGTNASFTVTRRAIGETSPSLTVTPARRSVVVDVAWLDRADQAQSVRLTSAVSGVEPEFAASLILTKGSDAAVPPQGRHRAIPRGAVPLGIGRSGFVPPGQSGADRVAWLFDNITAAITLCTTNASTSSQLNDTGVATPCTTTQAVLISGFVRFDNTAPPTSISVAEPIGSEVSFGLTVLRTAPDPTTTVSCFKDTYSNYAVPYYCAVPVTTSVRVWSGALVFGSPFLADDLDDDSTSLFKVCRYHPGAGYVAVGTAQTNQNFVIIKAGNGSDDYRCPPTTATPPGVPTWPHQPN